MSRRDDLPRDLLFGLLALQNGMVDKPQLLAAFGAWTASPGRTMADLLAWIPTEGKPANIRDRIVAEKPRVLAFSSCIWLRRPES